MNCLVIISLGMSVNGYGGMVACIWADSGSDSVRWMLANIFFMTLAIGAFVPLVIWAAGQP